MGLKYSGCTIRIVFRYITDAFTGYVKTDNIISNDSIHQGKYSECGVLRIRLNTRNAFPISS